MAWISTSPSGDVFLENGVPLVSGRVNINSINGKLTDDADLTFNTDTLTATKMSTTEAKLSSTSNSHYVVNNKVLLGSTSDAVTTIELTTDGSAPSGSTNRIPVVSNSTMSCVVNIAVKQTGSANSRQMLRQFLITNNGGTTTIEGTVTALGTDVGSAGLATVTCTITANDTDDCIKVEVQGVALTSLKYTCFIVSTTVIYA